MAGIFYLFTLLIAIAFAVVVIYIAIVLFRISKTLNAVGTTLAKTEKEVEAMIPQLRETIHQADTALEDVSQKLKSTDDVFEAIDDVGTSVNNVNHWLDTNQKHMTDEEMNEKTKPFMEGLKWSEAAFLLYSKWKEPKSDLPAERPEQAIIKQTRKEG
ncbi:DUF948 domain-containing protein [Virgibacillus kimchii]